MSSPATPLRRLRLPAPVVAVAGLAPASRAAAIDPLLALRTD